MSTKLSSLLLVLLFSAGSLLAETAAAHTTVRIKTYDEGDKTVTQHTVTTVVKEEAAKPKPEQGGLRPHDSGRFIQRPHGRA